MLALVQLPLADRTVPLHAHSLVVASEQLQLETADRLERALATYAIVAWRLLWLTYEARCHPTESIEGILPAHYWIALYCHIHQTTVLPDQPPTLADCVRWIARARRVFGS